MNVKAATLFFSLFSFFLPRKLFTISLRQSPEYQMLHCTWSGLRSQNRAFSEVKCLTTHQHFQQHTTTSCRYEQWILPPVRQKTKQHFYGLASQCTTQRQVCCSRRGMSPFQTFFNRKMESGDYSRQYLLKTFLFSSCIITGEERETKNASK